MAEYDRPAVPHHMDGVLGAPPPSTPATEEAHKVCSTRSGRYITVWTVEDVALVLSHQPEILTVKSIFPGAKVTAIRSRSGTDEAELNDLIPF